VKWCMGANTKEEKFSPDPCTTPSRRPQLLVRSYDETEGRGGINTQFWEETTYGPVGSPSEGIGTTGRTRQGSSGLVATQKAKQKFGNDGDNWRALVRGKGQKKKGSGLQY